MALKLARLEREVGELADARARRRRRWLSCSSGRRCSPTARRPSPTPATSGGRAHAGRLATWGVRVGWLAPDRAARRPGGARRRLPVGNMGRVAEPLRLARRRRRTSSGAADRATGCSASRVMPLAAALLVARARRRRDARRRAASTRIFLVAPRRSRARRVRGFTLAAANLVDRMPVHPPLVARVGVVELSADIPALLRTLPSPPCWRRGTPSSSFRGRCRRSSKRGRSSPSPSPRGLPEPAPRS